MNEQISGNSFADVPPPPLCVWCGIPLGSANTVRRSVCVRCYRLLLNANISDEEIFGVEGDRSDKKGNSPSSINTEAKE